MMNHDDAMDLGSFQSSFAIPAAKRRTHVGIFSPGERVQHVPATLGASGGASGCSEKMMTSIRPNSGSLWCFCVFNFADGHLKQIFGTPDSKNSRKLRKLSWITSTPRGRSLEPGDERPSSLHVFGLREAIGGLRARGPQQARENHKDLGKYG